MPEARNFGGFGPMRGAATRFKRAQRAPLARIEARRGTKESAPGLPEATAAKSAANTKRIKPAPPSLRACSTKGAVEGSFLTFATPFIVRRCG